MGNRLTETQQTESRTYGDIFDEAFPHYILMGMTPEQFWDGESWLKKPFRKAYRMKMEQEERIADRNAWLHGRYIREALHSVPLFVAGFMKGMHTGDYPEKPYLETIEEKKKEEARRQSEEEKTKLAMAMFQAMAARFNKNFEKRQKEKERAVTT